MPGGSRRDVEIKGYFRYLPDVMSDATLINPKNGSNLWSDQKRWGRHSATRGLVKELRDRIEVQEKAAKAK